MTDNELAETFSLRAILTVGSGILLCEMNELYRLLSYMTGDECFTHQIPRFCEECRPALYQQFPEMLVLVAMLSVRPRNMQELEQWLRNREAEFGSGHVVQRLDPGRHVYLDPVAELLVQVKIPEAEEEAES